MSAISGAVEPSDPASRHGYELTAFWKPNGWLAIDARAGPGRPRITSACRMGQNYVPGALESSGRAGRVGPVPTSSTWPRRLHAISGPTR